MTDIAATIKPDLAGLLPEEARRPCSRDHFAARGQPAYRAGQVRAGCTSGWRVASTR
jgi:hypothetical protein